MNKFLLGLLIFVLAIGLVCAGFAIANRANEKEMLAYIDSFERLEYDNQIKPLLDENGNWYFITDDNFKVMHLSDIHIGGGFISKEKDKKAINAVAAMITAEKPDLVIATGDISFPVPGTGTLDNAFAHNYFKRLMDALGVYYTVTLGNHDSEAYNFHNREAVSKIYGDESSHYCLYMDDTDEIDGYGNHLINLKNTSGEIVQTFYMLDTHAYTDKDPLGLLWDYENVKPSQIEWYKNNVLLYTKQNGGKVPSSLMFFHIPIMEVKDAYDEYVAHNRENTANVEYMGGHDGETGQMVYCSDYEEDLFETILEQGSTKGIFYGHDHLNNFVFKYKGVILSYGYTIDYLAYKGIDEKGFQRGCVIINCAPDSTFEVTHENYYQDKYVPLYEKEKVDMSK